MTDIVVNDLEGFPISPQFSCLYHHIFIYLRSPPPQYGRYFSVPSFFVRLSYYRGVDKSLALSGRKKLQRQKILILIYPIYNHNWGNISTVYIYNKTSIKRNILTIKQNTSGSKSG